MSMDSRNVMSLALGAAKLPVSLANLLFRLVLNKETLGTALQRLGWSSVERRNGPVLWFNVENLGDASTALPMVLRCLQEYNEKVVVLVTTPCRVVYKLLGETLPQRVLVQLLPLDNPWTITAFLKKWHPQVGVFLDSPFQRDLVALARASGVYLALLNAHMPGEDLLEWHARHTSRRLLRQALSSYSLIVPRTYVDVGRFRMFGATLGQMPGWSTDLHQAAELGACASRLMATRRCRLGTSLLKRLAKRPLWIAANTLPGEDVMAARAHIALRCHHPRLLTLVAPQELLNSSSGSSEELAPPDAVLRRLSVERRLQVELLSATVKSPERLTSDIDILIIDDAEALTQLYSLSEIVLVGGSMLPSVDGASSAAPAAVAGCALLLGPHAAQYLSLASDLNSAAMLASEEAAAAVAQTGATLRPITPTANATPRNQREVAEADAQELGSQGGAGAPGNGAPSWQELMAQSQHSGRTVRPMSAPPTAPDYTSSQLSGATPTMFARFDHLSPISTVGSSLRGVSTYPTCGSDPNPAQSGGASWGSQQVTCLTPSALASVSATVSVGTRGSAIHRFRWASANEVIGFGYELDQQCSVDTDSSEEGGENPGSVVGPTHDEVGTVIATSSVQIVKVAGQNSKISISGTSAPSSADGDPHQDQTGSDPGDDAASTLAQACGGEPEVEAPSPSQSPSLQSRYRLLQAVGSTAEEAIVADISRLSRDDCQLGPASGESVAMSLMGAEMPPSSSDDGSDSEFSSTDFYDASEELGQDMLLGEVSGFLQHLTRQGDATELTREPRVTVGDGPVVASSSELKETSCGKQPQPAGTAEKSDIILAMEQVKLPSQSQGWSTAMGAGLRSGMDACREYVVQEDSPVEDCGAQEAITKHEKAAVATESCTGEELTRSTFDDGNEGGYDADDNSSIASVDIVARFHGTRATHVGHLLISGTGGGLTKRSQPRRSNRHALLNRRFKSVPGLVRASVSTACSPSATVEPGPDEDMCGPHSEAMSPVSLSTHIRSSGPETDPAAVDPDGPEHNLDAVHSDSTSGPFTWRLPGLDELPASQVGIDTNSDISVMGMLSARHSSTTQSSMGMTGQSPPDSATAREDSHMCARLVDSRQPSHGSLDHYLPPMRHSAANGPRDIGTSRMGIIAQGLCELPDVGREELVESARSSNSGSVHSAAGSIVQLCDAKLLPPPPVTVVHDAFTRSSEAMSDFTPFALGPLPGDEAESDVGSTAVSPTPAVAEAPSSTRPGSLPGLRLKPVNLPSSNRNSPKGANDSPNSDFHFGLTDDGDSSSPTLLANSNGNSLHMPADDPELNSDSSDPLVAQTPASDEIKQALTRPNSLARNTRPSSASVILGANRMPSPTGSVSGSVGRATSLAREVVRSSAHGTVATGAGVYSVDSMSSWLGEDARGSQLRPAHQKSGLGPAAAVTPIPEVPRLAKPAGSGRTTGLQPARSSVDPLTSAFAMMGLQLATGLPPGSPKVDQLSLILSSPRSPVSPVRTSRALSPSGGGDGARALLSTEASVVSGAHEGPFAALTRTLLDSLGDSTEARKTVASGARSSDSRMVGHSSQRGLQRHLSAPVQRTPSPVSQLRSVTSGQAIIGLSAPSTERGNGPDQTSSCQAAEACPSAWPSLQANGSSSSSRSSSCPGTPTSRAANNSSSPFRLPTRASFDGLRQHGLSANVVIDSKELEIECLEAVFDALVREDMKRSPGGFRSLQCSPYRPPVIGLSSSLPASSTSMAVMTIPEDMEVGRSLYEDEVAECFGTREGEQDEESPPLSPRADSYNVLFSPKLPQEENEGARYVFQGSPAPRVLFTSASPGVPFGTSPTGPIPPPSHHCGSTAGCVDPAAAGLAQNSNGCRSPPAPIAALSFRNLPILSADNGDDNELTCLERDPKVPRMSANPYSLDMRNTPTLSSIPVLPDGGLCVVPEEDDGPDTGATDQLGASRLTFSGAVPEVPTTVAARQGDDVHTSACINLLGSPPRSPEQRTSCPASACPSASPVKALLSSAQSPSLPAGDSCKQLDAGRPLPPLPVSPPLAPPLSPRVGPLSPSASYFSPCATDPRASPIKVASTVKRTPQDSGTGATPWGTACPSPGLQWPLPPVPFSTGTAAGMAANTIALQMNSRTQPNRLMPALPNRYSPAAAGLHGVPLVRTQSQIRTLNSPAAAAHAAVQALGGSACEWYTQPPWALTGQSGGFEPSSTLATCASAPASTAARTVERGQPSTPRRDNSQNVRNQYANSVGGSSTGANYDGPSPQDQELFAQRSQQQYLWDRAREESRTASAAGTPRSARALFMAGCTSAGSANSGHVCFFTGNTGLSPVQQVPPPSPRVGSITSQSGGPFSGFDGNIFGPLDDDEGSWSAQQARYMQHAACSPGVLLTAVSASAAQFASMADDLGSPSWGRVSRQLFPSASVSVPMPNISNGGARVDPLDAVLSRLTVQAPSPVPSPHRNAQKSPQPQGAAAGAAGRSPGVRTSSPLLQTTLVHQAHKTSSSGVNTRATSTNAASSGAAARQGYGSSSGCRPPLPQVPMLPPLPRLRSSSQSCPTSAAPLSFWPGLAPTQNAATGSSADMGHAGAVLAALAVVAAPPTHQTPSSVSAPLPAVSTAVDKASLASLQKEFAAAEEEVGDLPKESRTSTPKARGLPVEPLSPRAPTAAIMHLQGDFPHIGASAAAFAEEKPRLSVPSPTSSPSQPVAPTSVQHSAMLVAGSASENTTTAAIALQPKAHGAGTSMGGVANASGPTLQVRLTEAANAILPEASAPVRGEATRDTESGRRPPGLQFGVAPTDASQQPQQQSTEGCGPVGQGQHASGVASSKVGGASAYEHQIVVPPGARYAGQYLVPATHLACDPRTGPAVWGVADEEDLLSALNALLRDPVERRSRGHAAAQGAAKLASSLVSTVWTVMEDLVIAPALQKFIATSDAP